MLGTIRCFCSGLLVAALAAGCSPPSRDPDAEFQALMAQIEEKRAFNACRKLEFDKRHREAGDCFVAYHDREREKPDRAEALLRAATAYREARDPAAALAVLGRLVAEHPSSEPASSVPFERGEVYRSVALFAEAAAAYEAVALPDAASAPDRLLLALTRAASYWQALGEHARAVAALDTYCDRFPTHEDAARVCLELGGGYLTLNDLDAAQRESERWFVRFGKAASLDLLAQAHSRAGAVHWRRGDRSAAVAAFEQVWVEWERLKGRAVAQQGRPDITEKGLDAVAMATYYRGEAFLEAMAPIEQGQTVADTIALIERGGEAAANAKHMFDLTCDLESPVWATKARRRRGELEDQILQGFERFTEAAVAQTSNPKTLQAVAADGPNPLRMNAKGAYRECHDRAVGMQWADENVWACRRRLTELDPSADVPRLRIPFVDDRTTAVPTELAPADLDAALRKAVLDAPTDDAPYLAVARHHYRRGHFDAVVLTIDSALSWVRDKAPFHALAGMTALRQNRWFRARRAFEEAVALDPRSVEGHLGLALMALAALDADRAKPHIDTALNVAPSDPVARKAQAFVRRLRGDIVGAAADYRALIALSPSEPDLHWNLCVLLSRQEASRDEGLAACRAFVAVAPDAHPERGSAVKIIDMLAHF
ncbi:MAG: tetratricopeptide repeat protein [Myxococcales bacterium]|nr:tetratricopeptide repeat protein [Myxococcales bacterium]